MFVIHERSMNPGTGGVVDANVVNLRISAKQVTLFLIHHQFLE